MSAILWFNIKLTRPLTDAKKFSRNPDKPVMTMTVGTWNNNEKCAIEYIRKAYGQWGWVPAFVWRQGYNKRRIST